jgi:2-polyprenyl-6-methoxyphenol hydroxylase-like FAD-dependent oxidoreductase
MAYASTVYHSQVKMVDSEIHVRETAMEEKLLIVGAGPTGLVLALWLTEFGVPFRIIDKASGPGETSRAMAVQAHTLESYQQIGFAEEVVSKGIKIAAINLRKAGKLDARVPIGEIGKDLSPYPFVLSFPQDDHEKLLVEQLQKRGVIIERNTELLGVTQNKDHVTATITKDGNRETFNTPYLFGCDGARSVVRTSLEINFPGGTYSQIFYVADAGVTGEAANNELHLCLSEKDFTLVMPVRSTGNSRLIGIVPPEIEKKENIEFKDVEAAVIRNTNLSINKVNWFSTYHSHHRVAKSFRDNKIFLCGDAAHIHSPAGGQGMNTGIGDAVNLAWKIAAVVQNRAAVSLLDTYETERIAFAYRLVATTDKVFLGVTSQGLVGKIIRNVFLPYIFPLLLKFRFMQRFMFKTVSQIEINYRQSQWSEGTAGKIHSGDRLPWVQYADGDNFKSLQLLDWQIHIYGMANQEFKTALKNIKINEFQWNESAAKAGLQKDAIYLIRPDGYVAYANPNQDGKTVADYISRFQIISRTEEK